MTALRQEFPVRLLCQVVGLAPSSYYYEPIGDAADDLLVRDQIEVIALEFPRYGYRRITVELARRGVVVNHKRVLRLMREEHLLVAVRRFCRTTDSQHAYGRYPNRLKGLTVTHPDEVWVADITYIRLPREFVYLAVVLDLFTRAVRGWALERHLTADLPKVALLDALRTRRPLIHHSDQGVQYAAAEYVAVLEAVDTQISMAAVGKPTENAVAERFMRTLKEEEVYLHDYQTLTDARQHIGRFLDEVYQVKRVHSALGYQTPVEFEAAWTARHGAASAASRPADWVWVSSP